MSERNAFLLELETEDGQQYADLIYSWTSTATGYDIGALVNHFLDLEDCSANVYYARTSEGKRYVEAALTLTTIYIIRKGIHEADVNGVDVRDCSHELITRLIRTLKKCFTVCTMLELVENADALMWVLFWIVHHEERVRLGLVHLQKVNDEDGWAEERLVRCINERGILSWCQVQNILEGFAFVGSLKPEAGLWLSTLVFKWGIVWH